MINLQDKSYCCGCGACEQRCPQSCITMQEDDKGLLYPVVDAQACVDCGLCEQVCPFLNEGKQGREIGAFAAVNADEKERMMSSSGGVFSLLSRGVIADGGVVFGARFEGDWNVVHDCANQMQGIARFLGSKYVQSVIGENYLLVEDLLKNKGRKVLFTGTPCQIAGLRLFLKQEYEDLFLVEVACHGVPSPKVWRQHLASTAGRSMVTRVNFRSKTTGWRNYSVIIGKKSRLHDDDEFMGCFIKNYSVRPSCFNCRFKGRHSGADLTLADFWGIETVAPHLDDDKGTSLVIVHTAKGRELLDRCQVKLESVDYQMAVKANPSLEHSAVRPDDYDGFWQMFNTGNPRRAMKKYGKLYPSGALMRLKRLAAAVLKRLRR